MINAYHINTPTLLLWGGLILLLVLCCAEFRF